MIIDELLAAGVDVMVFGLDMFRKPFGANAWILYVEFDAVSQVVLGAAEKYHPLCCTCYQKRISGGNNG